MSLLQLLSGQLVKQLPTRLHLFEAVAAELLDHLHGDREVAHIATTGSTDSGYVMEHGVSSFVFNGHVARGTFTDNWVNPDDGSRFQARGAFVFNLNTEKLLVDTFSLRCIKG